MAGSIQAALGVVSVSPHVPYAFECMNAQYQKAGREELEMVLQLKESTDDQECDEEARRVSKRIQALSKEYLSQNKTPEKTALAYAVESFIVGAMIHKTYTAEIDIILNVPNYVKSAWETLTVRTLSVDSNIGYGELLAHIFEDVSDVNETLDEWTTRGEEIQVKLNTAIIAGGAERRKDKDHNDVLASAYLLSQAVHKLVNSGKPSEIILIDIAGGQRIMHDGNTDIIIEARWLAALSPSRLAARKVVDMIESERRREISEIVREMNELERAGNDEEKNIVILGNTGSGKSTLGNCLLSIMEEGDARNVQERFEVADSGSCSSRVAKERARLANSVAVWDTPGLADEYGRDQAFLRKIRNAMDDAGRVSSLIITIQNHRRIEKSVQDALRMYRELTSRSIDSRISLCITRDQRPSNTTNLQRALFTIKSRCGIDINKDKVYYVDLRTEEGASDAVKLTRDVLKDARSEPFRVGMVARMYETLTGLRKLEDTRERSYVENDLREDSKRYLNQLLRKFHQMGEMSMERADSRKIVIKVKERVERSIFDRFQGRKLPRKQEIVFRLPKTKKSLRKRLMDALQLYEMRSDSVMNIPKSLHELRIIAIELPWEELEKRTKKTLVTNRDVTVRQVQMVDLDEGMDQHLEKLLKRILGEADSD